MKTLRVILLLILINSSLQLASQVNPVSIETSQPSYDIYPNPFTEGFYIPDLPVETYLEIFDIRGKLIYRTKSKANSMVQPVLLLKGIYILKLNSKGSTQHKIVKY